MIFLTIPVFYPIVQSLGLDPIWFGILVVTVVELGLITPPVGMNVFVVKSLVPEVSTWRIFSGVTPYVITNIVFVVIIIFIP
ncbi:TRAP transporter large permease subunit, partial [Lactococcus petauri]|nr:TRAP transporter large permease subunit [Lactococcus petauri]